MAEPRICPECGRALGPDAPGKVCPVCAFRAALELTGARDETEVAEQPGDRIGQYRLLEEIGEGGYGVVYLAEQTEPIRRQVALKIVKPGMDTREVIARFEAERQALALMEHPGIAKVLDAGATSTGRPYFVMELVRGVKITEYCDREGLSTRERLDLFLQVCSAVQHAHQKGIIHRDLKPSNILVTLLDAVPAPKVIDFGIAKATGQQLLTDKTLFTSRYQCFGTPAYMSPEQADLRTADIDTRSDIYSLGVLLYELLTGQPPFGEKELQQAGFDEMRRWIREKEPPKPSTRLTELLAADTRKRTAVSGTGDRQSEADSGARALRERRLQQRRERLRLVRGDLDWIVMKCLEKDRTRRYSSADALAEDLKRHLSDQPVTAAAPGAFYLLAKFARRHRRGLAAAGVLLVLLLGGLVWQAIQIRQVARQSRQMAKFFENALGRMRSSVASGRDTKLLREVLDQVSARVDKELTNQPLARASVRVGIGFMYVDLRDFPQAESAFRTARETYAQQHRERDPGVAAATMGLALVSLKQGRCAEAEARAREALALGERVFERNDTMIVHSLNCLTSALEAQEKLAEAEEYCRRAVVLGRRLPADESLPLANALATLGRVVLKRDRPAEAEPLLREALSLRRTLLGDMDPEIPGLQILLAEALERQGKRQ